MININYGVGQISVHVQVISWFVDSVPTAKIQLFIDLWTTAPYLDQNLPRLWTCGLDTLFRVQHLYWKSILKKRNGPDYSYKEKGITHYT